MAHCRSRQAGSYCCFSSFPVVVIQSLIALNANALMLQSPFPKVVRNLSTSAPIM